MVIQSDSVKKSWWPHVQQFSSWSFCRREGGRTPSGRGLGPQLLVAPGPSNRSSRCQNQEHRQEQGPVRWFSAVPSVRHQYQSCGFSTSSYDPHSRPTRWNTCGTWIATLVPARCWWRPSRKPFRGFQYVGSDAASLRCVGTARWMRQQLLKTSRAKLQCVAGEVTCSESHSSLGVK